MNLYQANVTVLTIKTAPRIQGRKEGRKRVRERKREKGDGDEWRGNMRQVGVYNDHLSSVAYILKHC